MGKLFTFPFLFLFGQIRHRVRIKRLIAFFTIGARSGILLPYSLRPTSSMPSPIPLNNLSTSSAPALAPFAAPLPTFLTASMDACVPSFSWGTDHLAAPSTQAPASLSALLGSLPDFFASSAVLCQALASS